MRVKQKKRDSDTIENVNHFEMRPQRKQEPYSGNYSRAGSTEYAELDSSRRVPIDANYQSLVKTRDQIGTCANYQNIQRGAFFNMRNNPGNNEDPYEEVQQKAVF